jgi:hypothetical protein
MGYCVASGAYTESTVVALRVRTAYQIELEIRFYHGAKNHSYARGGGFLFESQNGRFGIVQFFRSSVRGSLCWLRFVILPQEAFQRRDQDDPAPANFATKQFSRPYEVCNGAD